VVDFGGVAFSANTVISIKYTHRYTHRRTASACGTHKKGYAKGSADSAELFGWCTLFHSYFDTHLVLREVRLCNTWAYVCAGRNLDSRQFVWNLCGRGEEDGRERLREALKVTGRRTCSKHKKHIPLSPLPIVLLCICRYRSQHHTNAAPSYPYSTPLPRDRINNILNVVSGSTFSSYTVS